MLSAWAFKLEFGYKIFLKGVEMSKFFDSKIALPVAILVMGSGSASAALNCTTQPTCAELGYSKADVDNCDSYVYCPFDTSYKTCISIDCSDYTVSSCPTGGNCSTCSAGGHSFYKITSCKDGYTPTYGFPSITVSGVGTASGVSNSNTNGLSTLAVSSSAVAVNDTSVSAVGDTVIVSPGLDLGDVIYHPISRVIIDCVETPDCSDYTLTSCPEHGICSSCKDGITTTYKLNSCEDGYTASPEGIVQVGTDAPNTKCVATTCLGYTLSSCPTGGNCSSCQSGTTTKYKLNSCSSPYIKNGNTCYNCSTNQTNLNNKVKLASKSYLYCCNGSSIGGISIQSCRSNCTDYTKVGSYSDGCLPYTMQSTITTTLTARRQHCIDTLQAVKDDIAEHNALCPSYTVTDSVNTSNCNTAYVNGMASLPTEGGWSCSSSSSGGLVTIN